MTISRVISRLSAPDYILMRRLNRWTPPRWFQLWMIGATRAGDGWLWAACALAVLLSGDSSRFEAVSAAALAIGLGILLFRLVKTVIGRERPCRIEPHCWFRLLPPDRFSFPSGHTITAFAAVASIGWFYPSSVPLLLTAALSIALSRIVLGMHFLSDVLAGALTGIGLGLASAFLIADRTSLQRLVIRYI